MRRSPQAPGVLVAVILAISIATPRAVRAADRVELDSGDVFRGRVLRLTADRVEIQLENGGRLSLPRDRVRHLRLSVTSRVRDEREDEPVPGGEPERTRNPPAAPAPAAGVPERVARPAAPRAVSRPSPGGPLAGSEALAGSAAGAPRSEAPEIPPAPLPSTPPGGTTVVDEKNGLRFTLPRSFSAWPEGQKSSVAHAFRDAAAESTLTVSVYPSTLPVQELKRRAAQAYSNLYREFRVTRNQQFTGLGAEAWLLELNTRVAGVTLYQLQLFTVHSGQAVVFSFSATSEKYFASFDRFLGSLQSLEFDDEEPPEPASVPDPADS